LAVSARDVRWMVSSGGGTVDEYGMFTAPSSPGTSVVTGTTTHQGSTFSATSTITVVVSASPSPSPSGERYAGETKQLFYNGNDAGVDGGGKAPAFTLDDACVITEIVDYHYTAHGKTPGTIALRGADGTTYGPWPCTGTPGQGGVVNAYWHAKPNVTVEAGKYTIVDSDPATFSQNDWSKGIGIAWVYGAKQ
jgi:hypothetical protein